jgi:hypothetical protein
MGFLPFLGGSYGLSPNSLLGLFPVNAMHNVVHVAIGLAGLTAYAGGEARSIMYARAVGVLYAVLTVLGIVGGSGNFLGLVPLGGLDVLLHALTAAVLLYVGFAANRGGARRPPEPGSARGCRTESQRNSEAVRAGTRTRFS